MNEANESNLPVRFPQTAAIMRQERRTILPLPIEAAMGPESRFR
jgi:hypothetical protein